MSNELSSPTADKELDCSGRTRLSPAAIMHASSLRRSSADRRAGNGGFGPDRYSCMRPFATKDDQQNGSRKKEINKLIQCVVEAQRNHS